MTAFIVFRWSTSAETRENKAHKVREKEKKRGSRSALGHRKRARITHVFLQVLYIGRRIQGFSFEVTWKQMERYVHSSPL